jgi:hypothetical protein
MKKFKFLVGTSSKLTNEFYRIIEPPIEYYYDKAIESILSGVVGYHGFYGEVRHIGSNNTTLVIYDVSIDYGVYFSSVTVSCNIVNSEGISNSYIKRYSYEEFLQLTNY